MPNDGAKERTTELLAQARASRQAARYGEALALLDGSEDWPAPDDEAGTLLRAQILARRAPIDALELLARTQDVFTSDHGRLGYLAASMRAYVGTRNFESAAEMGAQARALLDRVDEAARCLYWHQAVILRQCLEQYDPLDDNVAALLASSDQHGRYLGFVSRAYMHAGLEQYESQKSDLIAALHIATANPGTCDPSLLALQVFALLRLGLETGDEAAFGVAADVYEWMPWSDDLSDERFNCLRSMAWEAFLRGEPARAQWLLRDSKAFARSDAWKVVVHLDRAYVARANGNEFWAIEELHAAHSIARGVEWSAVHGEERQALVMLAVLFAPNDMALAQRYVSLYTQLGRDSINPILSVARDRRAAGFERYAQGRVQQVLGNEAAALRAYEAAYEIFSRAGYHFRSALSAASIFEIGSDPQWRERALAHASTFPKSALYASLNRERDPDLEPRLKTLSPMQRQIAYALCEGLELAELSKRFSRSAFTLSKHVEVVFERLGVKNRKALRAALADWGVT